MEGLSVSWPRHAKRTVNGTATREPSRPAAGIQREIVRGLVENTERQALMSPAKWGSRVPGLRRSRREATASQQRPLPCACTDVACSSSEPDDEPVLDGIPLEVELTDAATVRPRNRLHLGRTLYADP